MSNVDDTEHRALQYFNMHRDRMIMLEDMRKDLLKKKHPIWIDAAFKNARNILRDAYLFGANQDEMLAYVTRLVSKTKKEKTK